MTANVLLPCSGKRRKHEWQRIGYIIVPSSDSLALKVSTWQCPHCDRFTTTTDPVAGKANG